ncbi:MAG: response regulator [Candidatus Accumulibacter sp.]|uniref:tetratricopeptide repeat protein n=1 Tax=Accumulibacter sp. TaxID=2053492 RepID=UPI001AC1CCE5|nr:tetratricopeptide repeat protein [Accumulibacter sp.]MBN8439337.1 response regulator [Accumulibacter sp.]
MPFNTACKDKRFLIIDDIPEMRFSLRRQVGSLGCEHIVLSSTVKDALEKLESSAFDIILCDYYLAGGTDGQQFLEFVRGRNIIGSGVLFVMVTGEKSYDSVVTAAECLPDDYLLKPFTADTLKMRIERLLDKKKRLARVDRMRDRKNWNGVINACNEIIATKDRYLVDALRIKGNALLQAGEAETAAAFYQQVLSMRSLPWASLGLARALNQLGESAHCKTTLKALIAESPKLMAAYDLLGKVHLASGDADAAMAILDSACVISPHSLTRHRAIARVAEKKGDFARVEKALGHVIRKTRHSPLRETRDFAQLGNALTEMGEPGKAVALLEEVRTNFKNDANDPLLAAVEAIAQQKSGNPEKAAAALARAMQSDPSRLPEAVTMALAKACLATGNQQAAQEILKNLVQENPESKDLHARISAVLRDNGAPELADQLVKESIREIIQLNNEAVRRAKAGELAIAAEMLCAAAHRLPGNLQVVANAATALLFDIFRNGLDAAKLRTAQTFQQNVEAQCPDHPKLAEMAELMKRIHTR